MYLPIAGYRYKVSQLKSPHMHPARPAWPPDPDQPPGFRLWQQALRVVNKRFQIEQVAHCIVPKKRVKRQLTEIAGN